MVRRLVVLLVLAIGAATLAAQAPPTLGALDATEPVSYFIADGARGSAFLPGDRELATWALDAWARQTSGALRFVAGTSASSLIRVNWVAAGGGQYGEMMPLLVNGRRGAMVFIRPDTDGLGPDISRLAHEDPLLRDTIVYLTCLHELGHALGLSHTAAYDDIMYAFPYGGDIPNYFGRYRRQLTTRADIAKVSGLSASDVARIRQLYR